MVEFKWIFKNVHKDLNEFILMILIFWLNLEPFEIIIGAHFYGAIKTKRSFPLQI